MLIIECNDSGNAIMNGNQNLRRHGSLNSKALTNTYPYLDNDLVREENVTIDGKKHINISNKSAQLD